jgi:hypothetical protein
MCRTQGSSYKKAEIVSGHAGDFKSRFETSGGSDVDKVAEERRAREDKDRLDREREAKVYLQVWEEV